MQANPPVERLGHAGRWLLDGQGRVRIDHGVNMVYKRAPYAPDATGFGGTTPPSCSATASRRCALGPDLEGGRAAAGQLRRRLPRPGRPDGHGCSPATASCRCSTSTRTSTTSGSRARARPTGRCRTTASRRSRQARLPRQLLRDGRDVARLRPLLGQRPGPRRRRPAGPVRRRVAHVAARFRRTPGVQGFDLFNEPFPGNMWKDCSVVGCGDFDQRFLAPLSRKLIAAGVRQADAATLFDDPASSFGFDSRRDPHSAHRRPEAGTASSLCR